MITLARRTKQQGVSLIEVMVTVLLLSTSLLALAALQNRSLEYNHAAYLRSQANIMAYDMIDRIRVNRSEMESYDHVFNTGAPAGTNQVATDVREWLANVALALPGGQGQINCDGTTRICTVDLRWSEADGTDDANNNETTTFTYQSRL